MHLIWASWLVTAVVAITPGFLTFEQLNGQPYTVTYNNRSLLVNGEPSLFLSGSIHYPRSTPAMWPLILQKARLDGLNLIEVYTFWNYHQPTLDSSLDWSDRGNLTYFLQLAAQNNLFVNLRIGPYVCAEWNYGGIPTWLNWIEGISFRCYNEPWMTVMQKWMGILIDEVREYFADQGGPIILAQVENELHASASPNGQKYIDWCGEMANAFDVNVPWLMCNGDSANNTINTCNGNDCTSFISEHGQNGRVLIDQPAMWTENEGWFTVWGQPYPDENGNNENGWWPSRTPSDLSYSVARWFARGGCHMNYYMWHGGNHYGRWAGSGLTNYYADDVNLHGDGLENEPKKTHMSTLHRLIAQYAEVIVNSEAQLNNGVSLLWYNNQTDQWQEGTQQIAFIYGDNLDDAIVFIESSASVWVLTQWNNFEFDMPPYSVSLVRGVDGFELYNTARVPAPLTQRQTTVLDQTLKWVTWSEPLSSPADNFNFPSMNGGSPYEQLNVTQDLSEFLWYQTTVTLPAFSMDTNMTISSVLANGFVLWFDGQAVTSADDHSHNQGSSLITLTIPQALLTAGEHTITLLSESLGIDNGMPACSPPQHKGIVGSVKIGGADITMGSWNMRPGLAGEILEVSSWNGSALVNWSPVQQNLPPASWYQTVFTTPATTDAQVILFSPAGMNRGHFYVNGHDLGRYWTIEGGDSGEPSQSLYHFPKDYLSPPGELNILSMVEILGSADPTQASVCISEMVPVQLS